jgi:hypothetical protein
MGGTFHQFSARILDTHGSDVVLSRTVTGTYDPATGTIPTTTVTETLKFIATAADSDLLAANLIHASDLTGMLQPPGEVLGAPHSTDTISAGGLTYTVLDVRPVQRIVGDVVHYVVHARA